MVRPAGEVRVSTVPVAVAVAAKVNSVTPALPSFEW